MNKEENKSVLARKLVTELVQSIRDYPLKSFLAHLFLAVGDDYFISPASRSYHHAFYGGLAYHSATAAQLGVKICEHYNSLGIKVNQDLVVAGILIHDIGKMKCYKWTNATREEEYHGETEVQEAGYTYTRKGTLLHHIPIGYGLVLTEINRYNELCEKKEHRLSEKKKEKLLHIILSHHGRRAWSSPVIPQFMEAYIVHSVEMMDGYVDKFNEEKPVKTIYDGVNY